MSAMPHEVREEYVFVRGEGWVRRLVTGRVVKNTYGGGREYIMLRALMGLNPCCSQDSYVLTGELPDPRGTVVHITGWRVDDAAPPPGFSSGEVLTVVCEVLGQEMEFEVTRRGL